MGLSGTHHCYSVKLTWYSADPYAPICILHMNESLTSHPRCLFYFCSGWQLTETYQLSVGREKVVSPDGDLLQTSPPHKAQESLRKRHRKIIRARSSGHLQGDSICCAWKGHCSRKFIAAVSRWARAVHGQASKSHLERGKSSWDANTTRRGLSFLQGYGPWKATHFPVDGPTTMYTHTHTRNSETAWGKCIHLFQVKPMR